MKSVTQRIKEIKQPYGGYLNIKIFRKEEFNDEIELKEEENLSSSIVGTVVDYMTRFYFSKDIMQAFKISLKGAALIGKSSKANQLLKKINGIDDISIIAACQLSGFDVCFRAGIGNYKPVEEINPNKNTIFNIKTMIKRAINFIKQYGPIEKDGFTFEGGYTKTITHGDGDFLTRDTLWGFKVSKNNPKTAHTLQLLVYYLMGKHSIHKNNFDNITKLGIFNPRKNVAYLINVGDISKEIIDEVEYKVIGYENTTDYVIQNDIQEISNKLLTISDLMVIMRCSRHIIMKYYSQYGLPLYKHKNKYVISQRDFDIWLEKKRKMEIQQTIISLIFAVIIPIFIFIGLFFML